MDPVKEPGPPTISKNEEDEVKDESVKKIEDKTTKKKA